MKYVLIILSLLIVSCGKKYTAKSITSGLITDANTLIRLYDYETRINYKAGDTVNVAYDYTYNYYVIMYNSIRKSNQFKAVIK